MGPAGELRYPVPCREIEDELGGLCGCTCVRLTMELSGAELRPISFLSGSSVVSVPFNATMPMLSKAFPAPQRVQETEQQKGLSHSARICSLQSHAHHMPSASTAALGIRQMGFPAKFQTNVAMNTCFHSWYREDMLIGAIPPQMLGTTTATQAMLRSSCCIWSAGSSR